MSDKETEAREPIANGDGLEIILAPFGMQCELRVNGKTMPGVIDLTLRSAATEMTTVEITAAWPWPQCGSGGKKPDTVTFRGYFVPERWGPQLRAWLATQP